MEKVIDCQNLVKKYGDYSAVNKATFSVNKGELFTILGPNGAGKTTLVKILTGQLRATSGKATVLGVDIKNILKDDIKYKISYVPQEQLVWDNLTVKENINLMGKLYGLKKSELEEKTTLSIRDFGLETHEKKLAEKLSGGMKRKLSLAMALMNDPQLLFLDEPTAGLDVHARTILVEDLKRLKTKGTTIILTTHLMEEAEALSNCVLIINKGKVVSIGSVEKLVETHVGSKILQVGLIKESDEFEAYLKGKSKKLTSLEYVRIKDTFFIRGIEDLKTLMDEIMKDDELVDDIMEINLKNSGLKETFLFLTRESYEIIQESRLEGAVVEGCSD